MRNSILAILSLAICSLPVDAEAVTFKQNTCPRTNGFCVVNCDPGMVVVGGGCYFSPGSVGTSANFLAPLNQWVCRPTQGKAAVYPDYQIAYAICQ